MSALPSLAVSLGFWQDRPPGEALTTARHADALGYERLWVGEMATYDAFALATRIGQETGLALTVGPLAVAVRDPMLIARGVASVADLTGRGLDVAVGTSSPLVVGHWHGRSRERSATVLRESVVALRSLLAGDKTDFRGEAVTTRGYHLRLDAPKTSLAVAAFGPSAVKTAALHADRMVLNLLTPASAGELVARMREAAEEAGVPAPRVTAWVSAAYGDVPEAVDQIRRGVVGYLAAPGYGEMFIEAGFAELVAFARTRPHPKELLAAVPRELVASVGLLGGDAEIRAQLAAYAAAGVDEIAVVPASVDADPGGRTTLAELRRIAG
ncbi:LLM class F420-dependent oxidoreductase [Actinocorallia sp. A-T 12471]|uniref:LLM class F420-dependent oxidoreductase n=1 Tax=Actinocorallia sp. A-T 12471 TaxID=3089813 RepID=UPI0029CC7B67|nr:LLM class F420-dependent oxidoreductase [Actinocorallia sp. A-T 12471]MDX6741174.1 LLM class F420-dependent oxidoreductase [Actinocorallia sp. A-T 12471]